MKILVHNLSKRYSSEWIFRNLNFEFEFNKSYAISGSNGSGKSTFLQILAGKLPPTEGKISFVEKEKTIREEDLYKSISMCAPYIELIEEFNLIEMLDFHFHLNPMRNKLKVPEIIDLLSFNKHRIKRIADFSSGMKQKLKLALAIHTDKKCLILDEPSSNLDENTKQWYKDTLQANSINKTVIIASNEEMDFMEDSVRMNVEKYK
jgi:ABC-type multidrug transport system ATPase subunit